MIVFKDVPRSINETAAAISLNIFYFLDFTTRGLD